MRSIVMRKPRNLVNLALTLALGAQVVGSFALSAHAATYTDIDGNWAQSNLQRLADMNLFQPDASGKLMPDAPVTRAEYIQIIKSVIGATDEQLQAYPAYKKISSNSNAPVKRVEVISLL